MRLLPLFLFLSLSLRFLRLTGFGNFSFQSFFRINDVAIRFARFSRGSNLIRPFRHRLTYSFGICTGKQRLPFFVQADKHRGMHSRSGSIAVASNHDQRPFRYRTVFVSLNQHFPQSRAFRHVLQAFPAGFHICVFMGFKVICGAGARDLRTAPFVCLIASLFGGSGLHQSAFARGNAVFTHRRPQRIGVRPQTIQIIVAPTRRHILRHGSGTPLCLLDFLNGNYPPFKIGDGIFHNFIGGVFHFNCSI